jgi:hypothetical protein
MGRKDDFHEGAGRLYGSGDIDQVFHGGDRSVVPWRMAAKSKTMQDYDPDVVRGALSKPPVLTKVDPRDLTATQPMVTREGVDYYTSGRYEQTGETFADKGNLGNQWPVVYRRPTMADPSQHEDLLLSGHHRGVAALLQGKPLDARLVEGGRPPRRRT